MYRSNVQLQWQAGNIQEYCSYNGRQVMYRRSTVATMAGRYVQE